VTRKEVLVFAVFIGILFCLFYLWDTFLVMLGVTHEGIRHAAVIAASVLSIIAFLLSTAFCLRLYNRKKGKKQNVPSKTSL